MDYIAELRKYERAKEPDIYSSEKYEEIATLLYRAKALIVFQEFKQGGRWHNLITVVHEVNTIGERAFFEIHRQVDASESQDGQENAWQFREVYPREITTTIYE